MTTNNQQPTGNNQTMKPVYFPFTYISEAAVRALTASFGTAVVYQASSRHLSEHTDLLDIRMPVTGDEERLAAMIKSYRRWAKVHQGSELAFFRTRGNRVPFFDETSVWQIRSDIKKDVPPETRNPEPEMSDILLNARIFLCMAYDFDKQTLELDDDLSSLASMEEDLMKNLKGEDPESEITGLKPGIRKEDPGYHKTVERIKAWSCLRQHDDTESGLFVTDSRAVFEEVTDKAKDPKPIFYAEAVPIPENRDDVLGVWQKSLMEHLSTLAETTWSVSAGEILPKPPVYEGSRRKMSLTIHIAPGQTPDEFFNQYIDHAISQSGYGKYKNTLLGLIEFAN